MFEERGGHNVKEPDFFVFLFFCFFVLFWLVFLLGGGGSHVSQGKRRKDTSLPTEYKRGNTEN